MQRARALRELGRYPEAEQMLRSVLAQNPESALALRLLGSVLVSQRRYDEAITVLAHAIALAPEDDASHLEYAEALLGKGDFARARLAATECVRVAPNRWTSHYTLALTLLRGKPKQPAEALSAVEEARRLAPNNAQVHNLRGVALSALQYRDEARAEYEEALRLDPQNAYAMSNLAGLSIARGNLRSASAHLTSGLATDPQLRVLHRNFEALLRRLLHLLWLATLGLGVVLYLMLSGDAPRAARAVLGLVFLLICAALLWWFVRRLPPGASAVIRGGTGRQNGLLLVIILVQIALIAALLGMALLPQADAARSGTITYTVYWVGATCWLVTGLMQRARRG